MSQDPRHKAILPSLSSDIDHILSFGYDDPAFINDVHALIGPNKVPEAKAAIETLIAAESARARKALLTEIRSRIVPENFGNGIEAIRVEDVLTILKELE